jgi:murein DD-endopeptidase MepM/ murein hydrolase activator NlpD
MSKKLFNPVQNARLLRYPYGQIYQMFGENPALYKPFGFEGHNGIDIVSTQGTPILATAGKIVDVKNTPEGYGRHIRLLTPADENGTFYELVFGHLDSVSAVIGESVISGQEIGKMGNSGFVISGNTPYWGNAPAGKGVHLHFGVRECSLNKTDYEVGYSLGDSAYIKNGYNGYAGYIDPMKFLDLPEDYVKAVQGILGLLAAIIKKLQELSKVG